MGLPGTVDKRAAITGNTAVGPARDFRVSRFCSPAQGYLYRGQITVLYTRAGFVEGLHIIPIMLVIPFKEGRLAPEVDVCSLSTGG